MNLFQFENIDWLWGLAAIPVLSILFFISMKLRKSAVKKLGNNQLMSQLFGMSSGARLIWKFVLYMLAYAAIIVALANPQHGSKLEKVKVRGAEIIIALDISNSMMADDISPNRLEKAKLEINQLLKNLGNDRIGLIVFAGRSFMPIPLTTDYAMVKMYMRAIDTEIISTQGTDIGEAIDLASESFSDDKKRSKALIIITDGEHHEDDIIDKVEALSEKEIVVHTVGLGDPNGVPIPFFDRYGRKTFRKDKEGNVVVTKLNEAMLNEIASVGQGKYIRASNSGLGLKQLYRELKGLDKTDIEEKVVTDYEDQFQLYLWIAIALLFLNEAILPRKNKHFARIKIEEIKI